MDCVYIATWLQPSCCKVNWPFELLTLQSFDCDFVFASELRLTAAKNLHENFLPVFLMILLSSFVKGSLFSDVERLGVATAAGYSDLALATQLFDEVWFVLIISLAEFDDLDHLDCRPVCEWCSKHRYARLIFADLRIPPSQRFNACFSLNHPPVVHNHFLILFACVDLGAPEEDCQHILPAVPAFVALLRIDTPLFRIGNDSAQSNVPLHQ